MTAEADMYGHETSTAKGPPASPASAPERATPTVSPPAARAAPPDLAALRLAYANACERMGMAHANGTRAEWEAAECEEVATRRALDDAIGSLVRERDLARKSDQAWLTAYQEKVRELDARAAAAEAQVVALSAALRGLLAKECGAPPGSPEHEEQRAHKDAWLALARSPGTPAPTQATAEPGHVECFYCGRTLPRERVRLHPGNGYLCTDRLDCMNANEAAAPAPGTDATPENTAPSEDAAPTPSNEE